jgi:hypothetical protein
MRKGVLVAMISGNDHQIVSRSVIGRSSSPIPSGGEFRTGNVQQAAISNKKRGGIRG